MSQATQYAKLWFLTSSTDKDLLAYLSDEIGSNLPVEIIDKIDDSIRSKLSPQDLLISYATSQIVPAFVLDRVAGAYNIHAASPNYPGRDPHHFAIYNHESIYGATAHVMEESVDSGQIIDVELFDVPTIISPELLLDMADSAAKSLIYRFIPQALSHHFPLPSNGMQWGKVKTTRKDFLKMCELSPEMSKEEIERRIKAFSTKRHGNIFINLHGYKFHFAPNQ